MISRILVVREQSFTLLQALRAEATMTGSGTKSMAQRSAMPFLISQPSMSALSKYATYLASNSASDSAPPPDISLTWLTRLGLTMVGFTAALREVAVTLLIRRNIAFSLVELNQANISLVSHLRTS